MLSLAYLVAMGLLAIAPWVRIRGMHPLPAAATIALTFCLFASFQAVARRLPLEPIP
jgi:hypothetical protein